jgi:type IV pilus assembly protein PilC
MRKHTNLLPPIYIKVIASGEKSGKLDRVLERLGRDLEANYDLISKIRGALYYPAFILLALIGVVIVVLVTVIPQLETLFKDVSVSLPITTRILLAVSRGINNYWWLILLLLILFIAFFIFWGRTKSGREALDWLKLKLPVFSVVQRKIYLTRFVRTMRILLSSGIPVLEVFRTLEDVVDNVWYQKEIRAAAQKIENGYSIAKAMAGSKQFPPYIIDLLAVGEESGNIDYVLANLSRFLEKDVKNTTKSLTSMIEPILIVLIGAGVGFIVASVIMPIYGLVQVIK